MDSKPQASEFWSLATAAYHVYREVMGQSAQVADLAEYNACLQEVARALANVAPIYSLDPESGSYRPLEPVDLLFGVFRRGATVLQTPRAEYTNLAMRRSDMRIAITIIRKAGVKFLAPREDTF